MDLTLTPSNVKQSSASSTIIKLGTAGEDITAGMPVYIRPSDSMICRATARTLETSKACGIAVDSASNRQKIRYVIKDNSFSHGLTGDYDPVTSSYAIPTGTVLFLSKSLPGGGVVPTQGSLVSFGEDAFTTVLGITSEPGKARIQFGTVFQMGYEYSQGNFSAPVNIGPPILSEYSPTYGDTVFCSNGFWMNSPTSYTYQWKMDGVNISGQTGNTYTILQADGGGLLSCDVIAINAFGSSSTINTEAEDLITVATYRISDPVATCDGINAPGGPALATNIITTTNGVVGGYPVPTVTGYLWSAVLGTNGLSAYEVTAFDAGNTHCKVSWTNALGNLDLDSNNMDMN